MQRGLNCPRYHGCSETKQWLRSCMPLRVIVLIIVHASQRLGWFIIPIAYQPSREGLGGECSMLAHCELGHTAGVDLHDVGMLHLIVMVLQVIVRFVDAEEWLSAAVKRIRLAL